MAQRHFDICRIASGGRRLVAHQPQHCLQLGTGHSQRLKAVAEATGPPSSWFTVPADVHRKMFSSNWFRTADDIGELEELAVMGDTVPLLIPQRPQHC